MNFVANNSSSLIKQLQKLSIICATNFSRAQLLTTTQGTILTLNYDRDRSQLFTLTAEQKVLLLSAGHFVPQFT